MAKLKVGDRVKVLSATIDRRLIGKILPIVKIENGEIYLKGAIGFWTDEKNLQKEVITKDAKYGVKYDKDIDPTEFFKTLKEAKERVEELLDDEGVDKKEIYLFEIGKVFKIDRPVKYNLIEI